MAEITNVRRLRRLRKALFESPLSRRIVLRAIPAIVLGTSASVSALAAIAPPEALSSKKRRLHIDNKFVLFPVNSESLSRRVRLVKNGRVLRSFTASLGLPAQWWAHLDVSAWKGETVTLSVEDDNSPPTWQGEIPGRGERETGNAELANAIHTSAEIWSPETVYKEPLRPAFHFTSKRGWINDPNGLMFYDGQYHLFFQHNPYGIRSENKHWGHAVSPDLVHWKELPIALYPRGDDDFPFSGSGVVDHENSSQWGRHGRAPMVVAFTSTARGECIVYSQNDGATWIEFDGNPVLKHSGRDPRLLWHQQTKRWIMAVYSERPSQDQREGKRHGIAFHGSVDLKSWQELSWIEGFFECPDLFALPVDNDPSRMKWVLSCASGYYHLGEFDGSRFLPDSPRLPAPAGASSNMQEGMFFPAFYAAQTFSDHPEGRRVQIAWSLVSTPDSSFSQMMSFPTTLSLQTTFEGVRLCREPVDAIRSLRTHTYDFAPGPLTPSPLTAELKAQACDFEATLEVGSIFCPILMNIGGDDFVYQPASQLLSGAKGTLPIPLDGALLRLRVLVDRTTIEIFGDRGQAYGIFIRSYPGGLESLSLRTTVPVGEVLLRKLSVHTLRSAWSS